MSVLLRDPNKVYIFTDGACIGNPGPGGWAALLQYKDTEKALSGHDEHTTNNRMELMGAIEALKALKKPSQVVLTTDSQYVRLGITQWLAAWEKNGWRTSDKKPVKNQDLWEALSEAVKPHAIEWCWVKGHAGHIENEMVDELARKAAYKQIDS